MELGKGRGGFYAILRFKDIEDYRKILINRFKNFKTLKFFEGNIYSRI